MFLYMEAYLLVFLCEGQSETIKWNHKRFPDIPLGFGYNTRPEEGFLMSL